MPTHFPKDRWTDMPKWLSRTLRLVVAVAGLAYIVFALNFTDRVVLPAGTRMPDGSVLDHDTPFPVVEGELAAAGDLYADTVVLDVGESVGAMTIAADRIGIREGDYAPEPGVVTILRHANLPMLVAGLFAVAPIYLVLTVRWGFLLRGRGLTVSRRQVFRLTMVGSFLNFCMPVGTTAGDFAKAYYAARHSDRRADAVMTIVMDRIAGLLGLVVLATVAGLLVWQEPMVRRVTAIIALGTVLAVAGAAVYWTPPLRRRLGLGWLVKRLPGRDLIGQIDAAAVAYRDHKGMVLVAVLLGVVVHVLVATSTAFAGYALGAQTPFGVMLNVVPVLFLAAAVSPIYQGLGIMELVATALLLNPPGTTANQIVGMLIVTRLYQMTWSLVGVPWMLSGDIHLRPERGRTGQ